jgi:hypothetical protein
MLDPRPKDENFPKGENSLPLRGGFFCRRLHLPEKAATSPFFWPAFFFFREKKAQNGVASANSNLTPSFFSPSPCPLTSSGR